MVLRLVREPIVQEVLTGPEITIDALLDLDGRPIHYVPRRRIRTLGGESIQGVTLEHDTAFETWIEDVLDRCSAMGARGPLTLQAFMGTAGPVLSEINARFGGGFPLALEAGGAYPGWLLDMIDGVAVRPRSARVRNGRLHDPRQRRALRPQAEMVIRGVVLDMDDTLYLERDYVRSGFAAIARDAGRSAAEIDRLDAWLWAAFEAGVRGDTFDRLRDAFPEVASRRSTAELVDVYRAHAPAIALSDTTRETLDRLAASACGWAS